MTGAHLDHRSDQYSLACALYWLFTGMAPFDAPDPNDIIRGHLQLAAPPLAAKRQGLNPALDGVLARAMAKRPDQRYASCAEFAAAGRHALTAPAQPMPPVATVQMNPSFSAPLPVYSAPGATLSVPPANPTMAVPPAADHVAFPQPVGVPPQAVAPAGPGYGGAPPQPAAYLGPSAVNPGALQPMRAAPQDGSAQPAGGPSHVVTSTPPGYSAAPQQHSAYPDPRAVNPVVGQPMPPAPSQVPLAYPPAPPGPSYGGPQQVPPRRSSGTVGWAVLGVVVAVVAVVAVIGVMAFGSGSEEESATSSGPSSAPATSPAPPDPLAPSRRAFPNLLPQGANPFGNAAYQDASCMSRKAADGLRLKDEPLQSSRWVTAWECSRDVSDTNHMNYTILAYDSPAAAQAVVAALPPNTATPGRKSAAAQTAHLWTVPDPPGPLAPFYHTAKLVVSFESDPARSNYLLYVSDHGTSGAPQTAPPSVQDAVTAWWAAAPL
jgi:serine/threonine-protein kinase